MSVSLRGKYNEALKLRTNESADGRASVLSVESVECQQPQYIQQVW